MTPVTTNLKLQLDATQVIADDGDRLATWIDLSGSGENLVQSDAMLQPAYVVDGLNGLPVVRFTEARGDWMERASFVTRIIGGGPFTVFRVSAGDARAGLGNTLSGSIPRWYLNSAGYSYDANNIAAWPNESPHVLEYRFDGVNAHQIRMLGSVVATAVRNSRVISGNLYLNFGAGGVERDCDYGEILIYDAALSTTDCESVNTYLLAKWFGLDASRASRRRRQSGVPA